MLVVGLTGGISSGKSTVADLFAKKDVPIIDADQLARALTIPGTPALNQIIKLFGQEIVLPDGTLDRKKLGNLIFRDATKRKQLEELLHPLIRAEMKRQIEALNTPYCIAMIPLLLETTQNPLINRILVVDTSEESQISRTMARDHLSREAVEAILKTQMDRQKRLSLADDVICNDGTYENLIPQVDELHEDYLLLAKNKKTRI